MSHYFLDRLLVFLVWLVFETREALEEAREGSKHTSSEEEEQTASTPG